MNIDDIELQDISSSYDMLMTTWNALKKNGNRPGARPMTKGGALPPGTLLLRDVVEYIPVNKTTIRRWVKIGYFPEPTLRNHGSCKNRKSVMTWSMGQVAEFLNKCMTNDNSYNDHINKRKPNEIIHT